jgi:predicted RNase H-like HicB family nuclease
LKTIYPTLLTPVENGAYVTYVPGLEINTQGESIADAIDMTRDAIGEIVCYREDENLSIPKPIEPSSISCGSNEILTLIDVDLEEFRRKVDNRMERTNVTIPSWLKFKAEKKGINFSQTLQKALKEELSILD